MNDERIPSETERYTLFLAYKAKNMGMTAEELMDKMSEGSYDRKEVNALQREFMDWEEQNYQGLYKRSDENINSYTSKISDPEWEKIKEEETAKAKAGR